MGEDRIGKILHGGLAGLEDIANYNADIDGSSCPSPAEARAIIDSRNAWRNCAKSSEARLESLRARVVELEEDKAMLDYLDKSTPDEPFLLWIAVLWGEAIEGSMTAREAIRVYMGDAARAEGGDNAS